MYSHTFFLREFCMNSVPFSTLFMLFLCWNYYARARSLSEAKKGGEPIYWMKRIFATHVQTRACTIAQILNSLRVQGIYMSFVAHKMNGWVKKISKCLFLFLSKFFRVWKFLFVKTRTQNWKKSPILQIKQKNFSAEMSTF